MALDWTAVTAVIVVTLAVKTLEAAIDRLTAKLDVLIRLLDTRRGA